MRYRTLSLMAFLVLTFPPGRGVAQEVEPTIQVNLEAVPTTHRDLLVNFEEDIRTYLTGYNWGGEDTGEKVKCNISIFIKGVLGDNRYSAQVFIGSMRPRYKSDQSSAVTRFLDDAWEFTYIKDRPINHTPYQFSDLTSFLDFYMFLVMGYDYDTYERLGGTPQFQKAADVARLGRSAGGKPWQPTPGVYARGQLIEELLSPQLEGVRVASWEYHFNGLDSLTISPNRGYAHILKALDLIEKVRQAVDPRNLVIRSWFDTKYLEIAQLFQEYPDPDIYTKLIRIDPGNQKTYEQYRADRK